MRIHPHSTHWLIHRLIHCVIRVLAAVWLALAVAPTFAQDDYAQYIQDIGNLERAQAAHAGVVIRYGDGADGKLLKAVLDPARAVPMQAVYSNLQSEGINRGNLPQLLAPLLKRYDKAFSEEHAKYESEYLDSLDISASIRAHTRQALLNAQEKQAQSNAARNAAGEQVYAGPSASSITMMRSLGNLAAAADKMLADTIRQQMASRMFSPAGEKRAAHLAEIIDVASPKHRADDIVYGEQVYLKNCSGCHQKTGQGIAGSIPTLIDKPSLRSDDAVLAIIVKGRKTMPPWGATLSALDIAAVANYVRDTFGHERAHGINEEKAAKLMQQFKTR